MYSFVIVVDNSDNYYIEPTQQQVKLFGPLHIWFLLLSLMFYSFLFRIYFQKMPQPKQDHSLSRNDRSKSINRPNKKSYKANNRYLLCQEQQSFQERQSSPKVNHKRQKQNTSQHCRHCESLQRKLKEKQEHFKQIVAIYHNETERLKETNQALREQLEDLYTKEQQARRQLADYKQAYADCQDYRPKKEQQELLKRKKQFQIRISPIQQDKEPITIKRISDKLLSQLDSPTFSRLLAGTPQPSNIIPNPDTSQLDKQNALKAEFERLMSQCQCTSNRSKKTTLRKQMASIANQLSSLKA